MMNGKFSQKYSARHLAPKSRIILALSHKQLSEQLVVLKGVNSKAGYPGNKEESKTFFREAWSNTIRAR